MFRKLLRFTKFGVVVLMVVSLLALSALALFGERALRSQVEQALVKALNRPVTVGGLSVNLAGRVVELRDVVIPGLPNSKTPTFTAPRVRVALSFRSLLTTRIILRGLELEQPQISVQVFPDGSDDLPRIMSSGQPATRQVSIERLQIRKGELIVNDQKLPLELSWPNVEATLASDAKDLLKGSVSAGLGPMRFGDLPPQDAGLEAEVRFANSVLHIDKGSFTAAGSTIAVTGEVDLHKEPKGEFRLTGALDLESFDRSITGTGLGLKGIAQTKATIVVNGPAFSFTGTMRGQQGEFDSLPIESFSTNLSWDGSNVHLKDMALAAMGGKALLDVEAPSAGAVHVAGTIEGVNAEPMLHWLFDYGSAGLGSRVSGPINLRFPQGASKQLSGTGDLRFVADPSLGDPLSGMFPFKADNGVITVNAAQFDAPKTRLTLSGTIQPDRHLALDVKMLSEDLAVTDALGTRLRSALGVVSPESLGFAGRGALDGRVSGTIDLPVVTGHFLGTEIAYLGVPWGGIEWTGSVSSVDLKSERLLATRGASQVEMSGTQRLGATGVDDGLDLNLKVKNWPAKELLKVIQSEIDLNGDVSGTMHLTGSRDKPLGEARLTAVSGTASGITFAKADLSLRFRGEALQVDSLKAVIGGGDLLVKGTLTTERDVSAFVGEVDLREVELSDLGLQQAGAGPSLGGHVNGHAALSGPIDAPRIAARFESNRLFYGDEGIGAMTLDIEGKGNGLLNIAAHSNSPRFQADVLGTVDAKAPHMSRLNVKLTSARVDPVLRSLGSRFENAVAITASANARIEGPLNDPDAISASVREGRLKIAVPEYAIEAAPGFVIDIERRQIRIASLNLTGEGTSLSVSGKIALKPGDENDLAITGRADLRVLSAFSRDWRARGSATLRGQIGGTSKAMRVSGGLDIEDGALRLRTFPQGLDGLNGRVIFNETQARVAGLEGRFGGGRVSVSGQLGFGGSGPPSFDFMLNGDQLGMRYPEGLRATFGAALRLQGTTDAYWLTGDLQVSKAIWTRKYAITSELFSTQASTGSGSFSTNTGFKSSPMRLDILIKAPGTLRLDNNLADIVARADLSLTGSPTEPQLLGQMEIERGSVFFRGNTYDVRKGVAHFSNPREINPVFDLEADTRVKTYRLTLQANGTLDRVTTTITSDPPLTNTQIASLLTGGSENDLQRGTEFDIIGRGGVTALASTWLDENITGRVAQGFGLSRLSIDPGLFGRTDTRVTVGKRVASGLEVLYSRSLSGGSENQLATAEYSLTNRFSLIVSWDQVGGFGADVRTRLTLGK